MYSISCLNSIGLHISFVTTTSPLGLALARLGRRRRRRRRVCRRCRCRRVCRRRRRRRGVCRRRRRRRLMAGLRSWAWAGWRAGWLPIAGGRPVEPRRGAPLARTVFKFVALYCVALH